MILGCHTSDQAWGSRYDHFLYIGDQSSGDVPEDVALHGEQHPKHFYTLVRERRRGRPQRQLCLPWRVHHASLLGPGTHLDKVHFYSN